MSQSVSFILPVRDVQSRLRERVQSILEILPELTDQFDVLIVDYGSRDETRDVAMDLVREYPQVDFFARGDDVELFAAVEAGIHRTAGEIVFIHDPALPLSTSALYSLWRMRNDDDLVMAQSRMSDGTRPRFLDRPSGRAAAAGLGSLQMIRRRAIGQLPAARSESSVAVDRVTRTDLMNEPAESLRLPKLLTRLRRFTHH